MTFTFRSDADASDTRYRVRRFVQVLALSAIAGILCAAPVQAAEDPYDGNLHFTLIPYVWLPSMDGTLRFDLPDGSPDVSTSATDILENLDFAFMATGDIRKGRWSVFTDFIYLDLTDDDARVKSVTGPGGVVEIPIDIGSQSGLKGYLWTLAASYSLLHGPSGSLDVFAGFRDAQLKPSLNWEFAGPLGRFPRTGSASDTFVIWDGIIGLRGQIRLSENGPWFIPYYADVGWGSYSSTWQVVIGLGYEFSWGDLHVTYRRLHYNTDGSRLVDDLTLSGPTLGASFHF